MFEATRKKVKAKISLLQQTNQKIRLSNSLKVWDYFNYTFHSIYKKYGHHRVWSYRNRICKFYRALGSEVQVFEMQNKILPNEDDVSVFLNKSLLKRNLI